MRSLKIAGLVLGAFVILALPASAARRFHRGVIVGPAFGSWGWYNPYLYGPYVYGPYGWYGSYPSYNPNASELKLKTNVKDADVYVNGAYAGKAAKLKSIRLKPDAYALEVRAPGYASFNERFYLLPGKATQVTANLVPAPQP